MFDPNCAPTKHNFAHCMHVLLGLRPSKEILIGSYLKLKTGGVFIDTNLQTLAAHLLPL